MAKVKSTAKVLLGGAVGFTLFYLAANPKSKIKKKLPQRQIKNVTILPNVLVKRRDKTYHLHHWMNVSSVYIYLYLRKRNMLRSKMLNGFLLGSILEGLRYKDRFKIIKRQQTLQPLQQLHDEYQ